jgi:trimeric autotransporter adhesin
MSAQHRVGSLFASHLRRFALVLFCVALLLGFACAQDNASVPSLVKFSGTISAEPGGSVGVIFALYKDQTGGAPLWQEVQTISVDPNGHYTSLLGSRSASGIPVELFSSNEARWLGVQAQGQPEQARVLLVSVPYALKAADAATLGGLPASAFLRADAPAITTAPTTSYVNTAAVNAAVAKIAVTAAISATSIPGFLPVFTDTAGTLGNSSLFQDPSTGNVGFGTTTPVFNLNFVSQVDPAAIAIDGYGTVGINFIGRRARGTLAAPTAIQLNDNIMTMQGRGYGATGFSGSSRANMKFFAAENWTDAAQGTYISMATTTAGTAGSAERLRITDAGRVGIGTATPNFPLSVNGTVQSLSGGFRFPDGSAQTTAAVSGVSLTSPDASITVAGTAVAPTVAVNTATIQQRVGSSCSAGSAIASISQTGVVTCQTVSGGGAVSLPVNWSSSPNPPTTVPGVLNVTNTATGPAEPNTNGLPPPSFFASIPTGVLGKATGSQTTSGISGVATGPLGVGVFAYTPDGSTAGTGSHLASLIAISGVTGFVPSGTKGDYPKAIMANLQNNTGGSVIKAEAGAATAPPACNFTTGNCQQLTGVSVNMAAISGVTLGLEANLNSPLSQGLNLNFQSPLSAGTNTTQGGYMINASVNNNGTGPNTFFQVDNNANINTSGGVFANGPSNFNGQLSANNGLNAQNVSVAGQITAQSITVQNLQVTGSLSKPQGTFKIDHPLDPANKFLYHSFVESPDMMNIYNGVIVLDKHGKAVVDLPGYFEALNQDFRYQLTSIGAPGPNLFVASEIKGNKFIIAGGKPGAKVSWQVTGIRHDAYADAHRIVVEEDKGKERGTYLHPELFQKDPVLAKK